MNKIKMLSDDLINKIAAGEVVERPASIVKELVENSLDSGATKISIDLEDSGKKLIKVSDNGSGMNQENARLSIMRHATSKIANQDDLFSIKTLGFRGEALASIAAVSQFSLITKTSDTEGFNLVLEGGTEISSGLIASEQGTSIEVQNIFFNTPARKKFLKSDRVELRHIIDIITRYALAHPKVAFTLNHEKHPLLTSPATDSLKDTVASLFGVQLAKDLLELNYDEELKISGFICKPYDARNDKTQQILFVNGRWIRSQELTKAVYDAYHSLIFVHKHPIFFLFLDVNPETIDVNVHPQKYEVKFDEIDVVCNALENAVKRVLRENNLVPVVEFDSNTISNIPSTGKEKPSKYSLDTSHQKTLEVKEPQVIFSEQKLHEVVKTVLDEESDATGSNLNTKSNLHQKNEVVSEVKSLPELKLLGQVHKTFFLAETDGGVLFIDQHAAHERVMYEKFMRQLQDNSVQIQQLLNGEVIEVSSSEKIAIDAQKEELEKFGFQIEEFGPKSYLLKSAPSIFGRLQPASLFQGFVENIDNNSIMSTKETIISRMACRSAVMAGDELTTIAFQKILNELEQCEHPFTCAHGRPTLIKTEIHELEKKFRRC